MEGIMRRCIGKDCEWWDDEQERCCVAIVSDNLQFLSKALHGVICGEYTITTRETTVR